MGVNILPRFRDVTKVNPGEVLYLKGNETTDGSLRVIPDSTGKLFQIEERISGAWELTGVKALGITTDVAGSTTTITAAGGLTVTNTLMRIVSDGGDVNITADPQISPGTLDGQQIFIQGTSDTNKVIFQDGNGLSMSTSVTVGNKDLLTFIWDDIEGLWIMVNSDTK